MKEKEYEYLYINNKEIYIYVGLFFLMFFQGAGREELV